MEDKIVKVIFKEGWETMYNSELTQGDYGLVLQIEGITLPDGEVEVHFSLTRRNGEAPISIGTVKDNVITVDIPDFILTKNNTYNSSYEAYAWIYVTDGESGRTIRKIVFTIDTRAEPTTNVPEDQKDKFLQEVRQVMAETKEVAQSVRDDADNGKFSGIPGPPGKDGKNGEDGKDGDDGEDGKSAYDYAVEGGFKGTEQEFIDLMAQAGHVDLTGYVSKEQHEAELLKAFVKVTTDKADFHHITDSANMKVLDFGMEGKTEQETTPGNQLFDISKYKSSSSGNVVNNGDGSITLKIYAVGLENRISECCPNIKVGQTIVWNATNGTLIYFGGTVQNTKLPITVTQSMLDNDILGFYGNNSGEITISDIMINEGSTVLPYEPFTNGPSPNPEYQQEIKNAGVLNEETGRYEHKCCVRNKNFWNNEIINDRDNALVNTPWTDYYAYPVYIGAGNPFVVTFDGAIEAGLNFNAAICLKTSNITNWLYTNADGQSQTPYKYTGVADSDYIWISITKEKEDLFAQYIGNTLQIELNSAETDYTPHASQPFTLTSPVPLTKWDYLTKRDGVWGWSIWRRNWAVDGTEWVKYVHNKCGGFYRGGVTPERRITIEGYCNQGRVVPSIELAKNTIYCGGDTLYFFGCPFYDESLEDKGLANWQAHLNENPLEFWADSDTEQAFHPLPDDEQELLNNLETYYGVTNVYNDQGCPMWLTYVADQELHWNQKLLQIQQALI